MQSRLRPLYIVSHLSNSRAFIDDVLGRGANGVELDTQFNSNCTPSRFFHGGTCNCGHEVNGSCGCASEYFCAQEGKIVQLLQYLRDRANPENALYQPTFTGFVWLDLKLPYHDEMEEGGKYFGNVLLDDVFNSDSNGSRLHLGLEQYNINDAPFVKGVSDQIKQRGRKDVVDRFGKDEYTALIGVSSISKTAGTSTPTKKSFHGGRKV
ncbi:dermonecrotic toxin LiSicTox-alphaIA2aii-like [Lineus longissimus]|uniref:dermonecrotic toxin LiSicTox-alphaIA2aii-like n=1 Tax=Lineus longissimus TaxID=88925 RepID=UPI00315D2B4B